MTVLTGEDARKFVRQATYGRPKTEAIEAARKGQLLARELIETGKCRL